MELKPCPLVEEGVSDMTELERLDKCTDMINVLVKDLHDVIIEAAEAWETIDRLRTQIELIKDKLIKDKETE